ncbi:MAG: MOP flippase family protein [Candidatus Paceibacterota bacterium]|jgi:PST family polysaccharide transporter
MNLEKRTIRGLGWSGISLFIRLLFNFVITAILARVLVPGDFGMFAMVVSFTNFFAIFYDLGLTAALVQYKEPMEEHFSSVFWLNILAGFILMLVVMLLASTIAGFYGESRVISVVLVLASIFFISSFGMVQSAIFTRQLDFKSLAIIEILAVFISGVIAIALAFYGFGVWSLVWQQVILSFIATVFLWVFSKWRPKLLFEWQRIKELLGFGLNLTGFSLLNYFNRNFDNIFIGKTLGPVSLGFYNLSYRLMLFPLNNISQVIGRVMFPSLALIQGNKDKISLMYIKATRHIAAITFPLMTGLFLVAPQFIRIVFGDKWERSVLILQILAFIGLIQSIGTTVGWIYQSQGRMDIMFRWGRYASIIIVASFIVGAQWDIEGVAAAYAIVSLSLALPNFIIPFRLIDLKLSYFIKQFRSIFLSAMGMGLMVIFSNVIMIKLSVENDMIIFLTEVFIGAISYAIFMSIFDKPLCRDSIILIRQLLYFTDAGK